MMLLFLSRMILLVPSNLLCSTSRTRTRFLRCGEGNYEMITFFWSPFSHSSGCPPFSATKKKKTGRQDDLSGSHSHCRSVRLSLLVFTSCHTDLASEALAPAWSFCANCTAPSLWMRLLCHVTSAALCIRQIHWSCSFCQFIKSGCFCSAFFLFFFSFLFHSKSK